MNKQIVYYPVDLTQDDRQALIDACGSHLELLEISHKGEAMHTEIEKVASLRDRLQALEAESRNQPTHGR